VEKQLTPEYYNKRKDTSDGYVNDCRECRLKYKKNYRKNNKEFLKEKRKEYYWNNRELQLKKSGEWRKKNNREWKKNNRERINNNKKERLKTDPLFKMKVTIRKTIRKSFKRKGWNKNSKTQKLLGCSFPEFKTYIEELFQEGMSFDNYGEWHYDHIVPLSTATCEDDLFRLNHYTNLQPLWAEDNLRKSNIISKEWKNT
jgi:hypothetical protein